MGWGSMGLKIANYKAIDNKGGMSGFSLQAKRIYERYKDMPSNEFETIALEAIVRHYEAKIKSTETELARRRAEQ